jgi:hypothetical protein
LSCQQATVENWPQCHGKIVGLSGSSWTRRQTPGGHTRVEPPECPRLRPGRRTARYHPACSSRARHDGRQAGAPFTLGLPQPPPGQWRRCPWCTSSRRAGRCGVWVSCPVDKMGRVPYGAASPSGGSPCNAARFLGRSSYSSSAAQAHTCGHYSHSLGQYPDAGTHFPR